jgi:hypothetical protein
MLLEAAERMVVTYPVPPQRSLLFSINKRSNWIVFCKGLFSQPAAFFYYLRTATTALRVL